MSTPALPPFDYTPEPYKGVTWEHAHKMRTEHNSVAQTAMYAEPLLVSEGKMQYVFDHTGKRYLDAFGGICTVGVGHAHPHVTAALAEQASKLWHTSAIYYSSIAAEFTEMLLAKLPDPLNVVFFTNSGSEANDLAMTLARLHTGYTDIVSLRSGYHGMSANSNCLTAMSSWRYDRNPVVGFGAKQTMNPDPYRGVFGGMRNGKVVSTGLGSPDQATERYVDELRSIINYSTTGHIAGFFAEPIQGVGGTIQHSDGYLAAAYEVVRSAGGLCISDEVQCGFGRLGTHFWGFEMEGVMPDIVTMAKSIGNGFPLAAVVTTKEIASRLGDRLNFNTYSLSPLSMAVGKANLEVIEQSNLQANCVEVGEVMFSGLEKLKQKHSLVGDVRGRGLLIGVELVLDEKLTPASAQAAAVHSRARELGLLIGKGGYYGNVLRIKPPMCWTAADATFCLEVLDICFAEAST